jgi:hypothetical protein
MIRKFANIWDWDPTDTGTNTLPEEDGHCPGSGGRGRLSRSVLQRKQRYSTCMIPTKDAQDTSTAVTARGVGPLPTCVVSTQAQPKTDWVVVDWSGMPRIWEGSANRIGLQAPDSAKGSGMKQ